MKSNYTQIHHPTLAAIPDGLSSSLRACSAWYARTIRTFLPQVIRLLLTMLAAFVCSRDVVAQNYAPTDILVPTGDSFRADAMNDNAEIVGGYTAAGGLEQPVVWRNGVFTELPLLPGAVSGWARGINNVGQMVGACAIQQSNGSSLSQACVWENGTVRALASVAGSDYSAAWAINDAGNIVGHVYSNSGSFRQAVVWRGSTVGKLVPPTAGASTWARAIDNFGRVAVSWTTGNLEWDAARWTPNVSNGTTGTMTTLGTWGSAYDINDSGTVSGNHGGFPYLWNDTTPTELQNPYWGNAIAYGVNNAGVAVGSTQDPDTWIYTALVWDEGVYGRDLNVLLTASTAYAYPGSLAEAIAINGSGQILANGANSEFVLLTPSSRPVAPHLPSTPVYVWTYPGDGMVDLYWPTSYHADSYNVKRSTVSGGPYTTIATGVGSSHTDTSVVNGTQYYYVASAVNGMGESADSPESAAMPAGILPQAPTSVSAEAGNGWVHVQWGETDYGDVYNVKRSTVNGGPYTTIATGVPNGYLDTSVVNGTRYYYVISTVNGTGESANSIATATAIPLALPAAPTNLTGSIAKGNKAVKLTWTQSASPEIGSNVVYRSVNGGTYVRLAGLIATTTYTDTTIRKGMTYSYVVTAGNVNRASSPFSNSVTLRP